uniref:G-patch domain-containing protein n=1 Tax=Vitis vinifera TaxID=29760 RepID=F6HXY8_VITVI
MKLSFSLSSSNSKPVSRKPNVKRSDDDAPRHEYVTEFDASKTLADTQTKRLIVPPKENEWRPEKKMKNLDLPLQSTTESTDIRFELESSDAAAGDSSVSYGLNIRENSKSENEVAAASHPDESVEATLLKKLKQDLRRLPDDQTLEDFAEVPVEGFGAALLAGYGWTEGRGIGRNAKEDVKIVEYNRSFNLKKSKDERRRDEKRDSLTTHRERREKEDKRRREEGPRGERLKHENGLSKKSSSRREEERSSRREEERTSRREVGKITPWLTSHIRVRVISKDFKGGRFYLKKAEILDVVGPTTCDISMDESRELIQGVDQELLETALPRRGGPVLVLFGKHKGAYGSLVERDSEQETGVVRDADSHALLNVRLEQIAEYVGDPSYIGY